jgi:hypothetical protein
MVERRCITEGLSTLKRFLVWFLNAILPGFCGASQAESVCKSYLLLCCNRFEGYLTVKGEFTSVLLPQGSVTETL